MIERERRSLLQRSARAIGLGGLIISAVCLSLPGIVEPDLLPSVLILLAGQAGALIMVGRSEHVGWPVLTIVLGLAALTVAQLPFSGGQSVSLPVALAPLGAIGMGAVGIVLSESRPRWIIWAVSTLASAFLVALAGPTMGLFSTAAIATLAGWVITMIIGIWVT
ncbi:MAG TPA: hypothetical protein VFM95_03985, partial [Microcella sp.]|nr:hypothetical protein [Microcella sp.]